MELQGLEAVAAGFEGLLEELVAFAVFAVFELAAFFGGDKLTDAGGVVEAGERDAVKGEGRFKEGSGDFFGSGVGGRG